MAITKQELLEFGMIQKTSHVTFFPMEKVISVEDDEQDDELENMTISITTIRNKEELCLTLPDGSIIYLNCETIEDLKVFEKCIASWEPNY